MAAYLQPTQVISSHSHRFPDPSRCPVSSAAPLKSLAQHCEMGASPRWAAEPGTVALAQPLCAAHGRPWPAQPWACSFQKCREQLWAGCTELCWMDAGCPPCPGSVENQCPFDRHSSLLTHFKPQHPTDQHQPSITMAKASSPVLPSYKQAGCVFASASVTEKHLAMRNPKAGKGLSMALPRSVLLLFLLLLVQWTVILFFQQPHCQLQWPGRRSDPE